jgi:hypothetical protein
MKLTLISLLYAFSAGLLMSPARSPQPRRAFTKGNPPITATVVCPDQPSRNPKPADSGAVVVRGSDAQPVSTPERVVSLTEPSKPWLFSEKTWQAINHSPVNIDMGFDREDQYIGVRVVLPFGS